MSRPSTLVLSSLALAVALGCQSGPRLARLNPFRQGDRTTYETPAKRIAAIRATAKRSAEADAAERDQAVAELIRPLATESDALVREATLTAVARFDTPLARKALMAGLGDADRHVRQTACRLLGERRVDGSAALLAERARADEDFDVRIAAARAMGQVGADKSLLLSVLEDPDPALQLVGVEAMRESTGVDLGNDVSVYVAAARGEPLPVSGERPATQVANGRLGWLPFF